MVMLVNNKMVGIDVKNITPSKAEEYLGFNTYNRPIKRSYVDNLVRLMRDGLWKFNGDTIRFDSNGVLLDGQHRLHAIVESGVAQDFIVVSGLSPESFDTIDGGAKRSMADALALNGVRNSRVVESSLRIISRVNRGLAFVGNSRDSYRASFDEMFKIYDDNSKELDQIVFDVTSNNYKYKGIGYVSVLASLSFITSKIDPMLSHNFIVGIQTGSNLDVDSPILVARNLLIDLRRERLLNTIKARVIIANAWNFFYEGKKVGSYKDLSDTSKYPKISGIDKYYESIGE